MGEGDLVRRFFCTEPTIGLNYTAIFKGSNGRLVVVTPGRCGNAPRTSVEALPTYTEKSYRNERVDDGDTKAALTNDPAQQARSDPPEPSHRPPPYPPPAFLT